MDRQSSIVGTDGASLRPHESPPAIGTEKVLPNDYPVYWDYFYVADGKVVRSDIKGTVADLKRDLNAIEIRSCDLVARGLLR
jgi:hypothetical protein